MNRKTIAAALALLVSAATALQAQLRLEPVNFGDFNRWVTRTIHESGVIGGNAKTLYEIGPTTKIDGNKPYSNSGGSPWATSNVYAKVSGITKGSNAVFPAQRPGQGSCAKLSSLMENVKVLGIINMDVMVAGTIFLGRMYEPITSTKGPYAKMEMGIPYNKRPKAVVFDYKVDMPATNTRVKSSGFGGKKTLQGHDNPTVFVYLQRRWEDAKGNIHAKRVATATERFTHSTNWTNKHALNLIYGNPTGKPGYLPALGALRSANNAYYARNSKGKMVKVIEEGWDSPNATPTHVVLVMSAGEGEPYVGTPGLTFYVDNVAFGF